MLLTSKATKAGHILFLRLSCSIDNLSHHVRVELYLVLLAKEKSEMKSTLEMPPSEQTWQESLNSQPWNGPS